MAARRPSRKAALGKASPEARTVWASASGLAPGSTYHYRVVATSELGTSYGLDQTFTMLTAEQAACPNEENAAASPRGCPTVAPTSW